MIKSRLLILARHLEAIASMRRRRREFNLINWFSRKYDSKDRVCGTVCCAVGEATFIPRFKKLGLRMDGCTPAFKGALGWNVPEDFFDLSGDQAMYLFSYDRYATQCATTPDEVAERIREFVRAA